MSGGRPYGCDFEGLAVHEMTPRELIAAALSAKDDDEARVHVWSLHGIGSQEVFRLAEELLGDREARARALGADILGQLGTPNPPFRSEATDALLAQLRDEQEADALDSIAAALGHLNDSRALLPLIELGHHPDPEVRTSVAFALHRQEGGTAIEALLELAEDSADDVRDWATFALGQREDADGLEVRELLRRRARDRNPDIRLEAVVGLAEKRDPTAVELLAEQASQHAGVSAFDDALANLAIEAGDDRLCDALRLALRESETPGDTAKIDRALRRCGCTR